MCLGEATHWPKMHYLRGRNQKANFDRKGREGRKEKAKVKTQT